MSADDAELMERRIRCLLYLPCVAGPLSFLGSAFTLITIYRSTISTSTSTTSPAATNTASKSKKKNGQSNDLMMRPEQPRQRRQPQRSGSAAAAATKLTTYHRLLIGLASMDLLSSAALSFGPFPMPATMNDGAGPADLIPAVGNQQTCTTQAFFINLGSASFAYAAMLMIYYVLVITCNVRDAKIATRIEPVMHLVPIGYYVSTSIAGIFLEVFNPQSTFCWVAAWPAGCEDDPSVPCERGGDHVEVFGLWLTVVPFMVWNCLTVIALVVVAFTVWDRHRRSQRFTFDPRNLDGSSRTTGGGGSKRIGVSSQHSIVLRQNSSSLTPTTTRTTTKTGRSVQEVVVQCLLYAVTFVNVMIWSTIGTIFSLVGQSYQLLGSHYWIAVLATLFFPMQGFFLFLIFIRPRYARTRRRNRNMSWWAAIWQTIWNPHRCSTTTTTTSRVGVEQARSAVGASYLEFDPSSSSGGVPIDETANADMSLSHCDYSTTNYDTGDNIIVVSPLSRIDGDDDDDDDADDDDGEASMEEECAAESISSSVIQQRED